MLSTPDAVLAHEFTYITDVHELPDGQLAVLDRGEVAVLLADAAFTTTRLVGRIGSGPGEYRAPSRLFGMANAQFAILKQSRFDLQRHDADGQFVGLLKPEALNECGGGVRSPVGGASFNATDATGRVYLQGRAVARDSDGEFQLADSAPILRWTPPCALDTVAYIPVRHPAGSRVMAGDGVLPFVVGAPGPRKPFVSESQWAVLPHGRIAVVHLDPYRVDIIDAEGPRTRGPNISDAAILLTDGHKAQWREEQQRSRPVVVMRRGGGTSQSMRAGPYREPAAWPRVLPPFARDAVRAAPDGRVWVQRHVGAGAPSRLDVFDGRARRVQQVVLPAGRRLLGVGRRALYLLYMDEDDLQYIERYRLPNDS